MKDYAFPVYDDVQRTLLSWAPYLRFLGSNEKFVGNVFEWQDWPLEITAAGAMTVTPSATEQDVARYFQVGKMVFVYAYAQRTLGGVASTALFMTLPVTTKNVRGLALNVIISNGVAGISGTGIPGVGATTCEVRRYDGANFNLVLTDIRVSGFYEAE